MKVHIRKTMHTAGALLGVSMMITGAPAAVTFAEEAAPLANVSDQAHIEELRLKKEEAQKAYDEALKNKLIAEDVVENARRAANDASEEYDRVRESYSKGFAGFLQWVTETEEDPVRVADAQQVLNAYYAGDVDISADDPSNLTRMLYTAYWLEDLAEYFRENGINAGTSHAAMSLAQSGVSESNRYPRPFANDWDDGIEDVYDFIEAEIENDRLAATKNSGIFKGFWQTSTGISSSQNDGIPEFAGFIKQVNELPYDSSDSAVFLKHNGYKSGNSFYVVYKDNEDLFDNYDIVFRNEEDLIQFYYVWDNGGDIDQFLADRGYLKPANEGWSVTLQRLAPVFHPGGLDYQDNPDESEDLSQLTETFYCDGVDYEIIMHDKLLMYFDHYKGITVGQALGVAPDTGYNYSLGAVFNGEGTYTIDEYVRTLREYYSITDPMGAKAVLDKTKDDMDKAGRELEAAQENLFNATGRLKGAEKEYDEAVAGLAGITAVETGDTEGEAQVSILPDEGYVISEGVLSPGEVTVAVNEYAGADAETEADDYTGERVAAEGTVGVYAEPEEESYTEQSVSPVDIDGENMAKETFTVQATSAAALNSEGDIQAEESAAVQMGSMPAELSDNETSEDSGYAVGNVNNKNDVINVAEYPVSHSVVQPHGRETEVQSPHLLAEVLSYIFNGGAIALILPAGFKKRKKDKITGGVIQGEV